MNKFLKSFKSEILVEQHIKLYAQQATTPTITATVFTVIATATTTTTATTITARTTTTATTEAITTTTTTKIITTATVITATTLTFAIYIAKLVTTIAINAAPAVSVTFELARRKRNYHFHRALQQNSSLKVLQSILLLLIIIFHCAATSLSEATSSISSGRSNHYTEQDIELLRKAFLRKFGMKEQPQSNVKLALPVPNYMWNIYEKIKNEDIEWVRHYYPQNIMESDKSKLLLEYDLSVTVQNITNEIVSRAELKLKLRYDKCRRHIKVFEIDQRNFGIWRLLDARFIKSDLRKGYQWIDLDVTEAVRRRRPNMHRVDFAVEISCNNLAAYPSTSLRSTIFSALPDNRKQASALVVYVQTANDIAKVRHKRKANARRRHQHKKISHKTTGRNYCRRTELLVDFNELNWQDWILAPSSYSAYQCQGECPNPLTNHFNTTNHAIVQGLINSVDPNLVPAPCCVPIEMESLAILYIDVEGKIVIKNYPDMEVVSCGCR